MGIDEHPGCASRRFVFRGLLPAKVTLLQLENPCLESPSANIRGVQIGNLVEGRAKFAIGRQNTEELPRQHLKQVKVEHANRMRLGRMAAEEAGFNSACFARRRP